MPDLSQLSDDQLLALHSQDLAAASPGDLSHISDSDLLAMHAQDMKKSPAVAPKSTVLGMADAAMRGGAQGASLGFADEATAGIGGLKDYLAAKMGQRGDISFPDAYHTWRDSIRKADAKSQAEHPVVYGGGQIAGALGGAFVPGLGALNAGKGAGLIEAAGKGAIQGGLAGAGDAKEITNIPDEAETGALWGAGLGGGLHALGSVGSAVADKLKPAKMASVLLNVPEEAIQRYIANPEAVKSARPRAEIVQDFLQRAEKLKQDVIGGSKASRDILSKEGQTMSGSEIADIFDSKADELAKRSEGVWDNDQIEAAYNWLRGTAKKYRPKVPEELTAELQQSLLDQGVHPDIVATMPQEVDRQISTNRVKDTIQGLDKRTQYEGSPGQFVDVDDQIRKGVRGDLDQSLKARSPAYAEQMKGVAKDTGLLNDVADLAKSPQGFDNLLKRTQRGNTPHLMDSLNQFDQRTGGGMMNELQNSAVKDALAKGNMNGSRNELLHGGVAGTIGEAVGGFPGKMIGRTLGFLGGASVDKYGGAIARGAVDTSSKLQSMLASQEGLQTLGKYAAPLAEAAKRGNQSLAVTHYMLAQTNEDYRNLMDNPPNQTAAPKRRMPAE